MENYLVITGAWVGPEPQRGSWSNPTPVCRVKEQLRVLISALVMPPALTLPRSHRDILQDSTGQPLCASLAAVSMPPSSWLRHSVPDLQRPTTCCHSPESYLKKIAYSHSFLEKTTRKMKSAQTFPLQHGYIPSRLPTETHTKDCTARYTTQHRNASSATPPSFFTQKLGYLSLSPQFLHFPPLFLHSDAVPPLPTTSTSTTIFSPSCLLERRLKGNS